MCPITQKQPISKICRINVSCREKRKLFHFRTEGWWVVLKFTDLTNRTGFCTCKPAAIFLMLSWLTHFMIHLRIACSCLFINIFSSFVSRFFFGCVSPKRKLVIKKNLRKKKKNNQFIDKSSKLCLLHVF